MIIEKIIESKQAECIDIEEITLLSTDEAKAFMENITPINDYWWLRSPGDGDNYSAFRRW